MSTTQLSKHYTEADRETWKSYLDEGMPYRRVAEVVGVHRDTIRKYLPGMGWTPEQSREFGTFMKHHNEKMRKSVYG